MGGKIAAAFTWAGEGTKQQLLPDYTEHRPTCIHFNPAPRSNCAEIPNYLQTTKKMIER